MVDFSKLIKNSNKFREPALLFIATGHYCTYPEGTSEFFAYWDELMDRCKYGYIADDGDFISGYNYFYLNFCPIQRIIYNTITNPDGSTTIKKTRDLLFPDFYDYDYYFFLAVEQAETEGKHLCALKSRRKGYSYKNAAMACRNYYLFAGSKTYIYASNKQYLTEDGILTKAWDYMDFIDKNTAWGKKRSVNTLMRKRAGFFTKDEYGNEIELGFKSEIIGVTLKDNPDVVRGKAGKLIIFEEAGSFSELGAAWQIARPSVEQDGMAFGTMIAFGTGGDEDSHFETLKDMFYNPDGYNCIGFDNIWDETPSDKKCGFFIPQYTNMDFRDDAGNRIYMDNDGNTLRRKSVEYILAERRKVIENATNSVAVDRYVAEHCITPLEACLEFGGNIFPKKELQEQLAKIRINKSLSNMKQVGDLVWETDGSLKWVIKKHGDITHYPLKKDDDPTGSIVIWEHPMKDAPIGLYILGVDPYDHDLSGTNSLGSTFVYKRFLDFENYYDIIVAEYTGRPSTAEEYYENLRKLAVYYNGRIMYENERKGLFPYFTAKHCDYLLADQPDIISDIVGNTKVLRKKGCHMNKQIKQWGEGLIKDWLNEEQAPGKKNLHNILSEPLLEELISYNDTGNFDRVMALMQVMIYREQLYNLKVKEKKKENKNRVLFEGPIFTQAWFHDDEITDNLKAYMF
ncbi:terminase large subunit [uncultured phage cr82_1]|uniref:terminase large subunit n=1 Tax=uncultured phage cr82_1 TaxID=2986416 RepID=UPI001C756D57|nr:terminase large subunit [uncultured phage cr82_1]